VVRHHLAHHDFSRWFGQVLRDDVLAASVAALEDSEHCDTERVRTALLTEIEKRYLG